MFSLFTFVEIGDTRAKQLICLPPAYEVREKVLFSQVSVHIPGGGYHIHLMRVPHLANAGYPTWLMGEGFTHPSDGGYPIQPIGGTHLADGMPPSGGGVGYLANGGTPCRDWMGVPPSQDWMGVPSCWDWMGYPLQDSMGYPHWDWMGYPPLGLEGVGLDGVPSRSRLDGGTPAPPPQVRTFLF